MIKKFFPIISLLIFLGCQSDPAKKTETDAAQEPTLEQLKSRAVDESDISGRLQPTAATLQEEYAKAEAALTNLKKVRVTIDAACVLTIVNQANGEETTRVNLRDLDAEGFNLIPDVNPGEFPGLRIRTIGESPMVEVWKNGAIIEKKTELVIYMADRPAIERITPFMLQAINICQGATYQN